MDLQYLRAFIRFSEIGHLSQTANEFGVPKGTLWKYINRVEDELGTPLYEHSKKRFALTDDGKRFLQTAKAMVAKIDECSATLRRSEITGDSGEQLRIGSFELMTPYGITDQLIDFKQIRPGLEIRINQNSEKALEKMLASGAIELAYIRSWGEPDSRYESIKVCSDEACIVLHTDHPLAKKDVLTWKELKGERFFLLSEGGITYRECIKCCERAGFRSEIGGTFFSADTVFRMVGQGMGISFILLRPGKRFGYIPNIVFKKVDPPCILNVYLVRLKKYELSRDAREFWEYVKQDDREARLP